MMRVAFQQGRCAVAQVRILSLVLFQSADEMLVGSVVKMQGANVVRVLMKPAAAREFSLPENLIVEYYWSPEL